MTAPLITHAAAREVVDALDPPREIPLFSPCCRKHCTLFGVADALGGVLWCPCGMAYKMRELVIR